MAEDQVLTSVNASRFEAACRAVLTSDHERFSIGTYKEKSLHLVLKRYFQPDAVYHEVPIGRFVADAVVGKSSIVEIQTSGFGAMRRKLEFFLEQSHVYVVYPVAAFKYVSWIDENGTISNRRRSPKKGLASDVLPELLSLSSFLGHPRFHCLVAMMEVDEFRLLDGWGNNGKRGSSRFDRIPSKLCSLVPADSPPALRALLPPSLPLPFDQEAFGRALHFVRTKRWAALRLLEEQGIVTPIGKQNRKIQYTLSDPS